VTLIPPPQFKKRDNSKATPAQKRGIWYQKKILSELSREHGEDFIPSPWFRYGFRYNNTTHYNICQPDGILLKLIDSKLIITIIEVKLAHTADAYFQLFDLYLPVLQHYYCEHTPFVEFRLLEIVKFYDARKVSPARVHLTPNILDLPPNEFCVKIWTPK
jgi:hypothetical protein